MNKEEQEEESMKNSTPYSKKSNFLGDINLCGKRQEIGINNNRFKYSIKYNKEYCKNLMPTQTSRIKVSERHYTPIGRMITNDII